MELWNYLGAAMVLEQADGSFSGAKIEISGMKKKGAAIRG